MSTTLDRLTSEDLALMILSMCGVLLFGALIMEHVFSLVPCPLCLMQRIWFFAAGLFAFAGLMHDPRWGIYPLLSLLSSLTGGGFAIRQLYLQRLPADQVPACGPDINYMIDAFPLGEVLAAMTRGTGDCAAVSWSFLGISLPGWALLGFVAIAILAVLQLRAGNQGR
ncbi:MAG: disulfide bond formation protein B [Pseudomonadales bacterium]